MIDTTIRLSDLLIFGGGLYTFVRVMLAQRDNIRDLTRLTQDHEERLAKVEGETGEHRDWLVRSGFDRRQAPQRREH